MKKLLALVLALVMTLSLCTISNAKYGDAADVKLDEAVDVMTAVGVFQGDENGKFLPQATLTREAAAKLIAYLDLGAKTAEALPAVKAFKDVEASRWSAKYIAYCADAGYINGDGNGNFLPTADLTGYAFGKMLLCVLGYDATIEAFTGSNWSIAVAKLMESNKISKGVDAPSAVLTREQAAQYCLNALKADMVDYKDKGTGITVAGVEIKTGASKAEVVANDDFDYCGDEDDEVMQLCEKLYEDDLVLCEIGEFDAAGRPSVTWEYKDEEVGTYADEPDYVITAKEPMTMYDLLEANGLEKKVTKLGNLTIDEDDDTLMPAGITVELYVDEKTAEYVVVSCYLYAEVTDVDALTKDTNDPEEKDRIKAGIANVYTLEEIDGDEYDDEWAEDYAVVFVDTLTDADYEEDETKIFALGELKKNDKIALKYTCAFGYSNYIDEYWTIEGCVKMTTVDGKITASKTTDNYLRSEYQYEYIKIDGTKYCLGWGVDTDIDSPDFRYDDTYTFYLDPNGVVIAVTLKEEAEVALQYAVVNDGDAEDENSNLLNTAKNQAVVQLTYLDGTKETVAYELKKAPKDNYGDLEIDKGDLYFTFNGEDYVFTEEAFKEAIGSVTDKKDGILGHFVTYTKNDNGVTLKLATSKEDVYAVGDVSIEKDEKVVAAGLYATSSTKVVVLKKGAVVKTYTGVANFPKEAIASEALVLFGSTDSYAKEIYVFDAEAKADAETIKVALFVKTIEDTEEGILTTFYVDGAKKDIVIDVEEDDFFDDVKAGTLYAIEIDSDGVGTVEALVEDTDFVKGEIDVFSKDEYIVVGEEELDFADKYSVFQVSADGKTVSEGTLKEGKDAVAVLNDAEEVIAVYIYKDITILTQP